MKQSIGMTYTLNFIIIFILIVFAFIMGIMSYMKAFRINSLVSNAIENHEVYNYLAKEQMDRALNSIGYRKDASGNSGCKKNRNGGTLIKAYGEKSSQNHRYCIYEFPKDKNGYIKYGIVTYLYIDVPVINQLIAIPVYTETEKIYEFNVNRS